MDPLGHIPFKGALPLRRTPTSLNRLPMLPGLDPASKAVFNGSLTQPEAPSSITVHTWSPNVKIWQALNIQI